MIKQSRSPGSSPPFDSLSNAIVCLAVFAMGFSFNYTISEIPLVIFFIAFCIAGVHAFTTIVDYSVDKKVGQKTFAVVFGKRTAALFALFSFLIALAFANVQTFIV